MDGLTLFGLLAVTGMLVFYALEERSPWVILAFAGTCALASLYGFLQGAWPFVVGAPRRRRDMKCGPQTGNQMIGRLNHVAIAVPQLAAAVAQYSTTLGAQVSEALPQPEHGVTVVFVTLPNTKIELLEPLGENSPIAAFLQRNPAGGIHHLCYEVADIRAARDRLRGAGARVLGDGEPRIGAHGKPVLFLHPKDFNGTLVELEQA